MASLLRELAEYVELRTGLALGAELFAGHIPADGPDEAVVLIEAGGIPDNPRVRGNVGEYGFQVIARGEPLHFTQAHNLAHLVHAALHDLPGADLGEWQVCVMEADSPPQLQGWDEHQRAEVSNSYTLRGYHRATWWAV